MRVKTREELPWLYYPEFNTVRIINAHNFPGGGAVGGLLGGEVAYYPLDEGTGTTSADDSGNANPFSLFGSPTWVASPANGINFTNPYCLRFDGNTQGAIANSTTDNSINDTLSVAAWVNLLRTPTATYQTIFAKRTKGSEVANFGLNISSTQIQWYFNPGAGFQVLTAAYTLIPTNTWVHVCGIFEKVATNTAASFYVNGNLESSGTLTGNVVATSSKLTLACYGDIGDRERANVEIDDFRLFNSALSLANVQTLANGGP